MRNLRTGLKATLCLLLFNSSQLQAANVNFPDENLANKIRSVLNIPDGNAITTESLENLTELVFGAKRLSKDQKVKDIEGLQHAANLKTLNLTYHEIETIEQIAGLTNLESINFYSNLISDITPVVGLTNLKTVAVGRNQISDISVLADLPQLTQVQIQGNQVTDSTPLHNLTNMTRLFLGTHDDPGLISDISFVENMPNLTHFYASKSNVSDISSLANSPGLIHVDIAQNNISDITAIAEATGIKSLFINNNSISDISPTSGMVNMEHFNYSNNPIASHDPVANHKKLKQVWFANTNATSVEHLAGTTDLWYALIHTNEITDLTGLKDSVNLEVLYLYRNTISDLSPLQNLNKLRVLSADNNEIADLTPLSQKPALRDLRLRNNMIEDASPLGSSTALWRIWLSNNLLTTLGDWSNLSILDEVSISENLLTDISTLGNCTALTEIYAQSNQITTIGDWSNLTKLKILNLERNQISDLDSLATATNLTHILFGSNQVTRSDFIKNLSKLVYLNGYSNQISKLDYLDNLTNLAEFYMQNNKIRGDVTLPDGLDKIREFFVQNNFITSFTNLETLQGIANTQDDFHAYNNYLDISSGSEVVNYEAIAFGLNENEDPEVLYQPQYNPNGDRDQDGMHDVWEIHNWTEPLIADGHLDPDGDLYTNLEEYEGQTDPQDGESFPTFPPTAIYLSHYAVEENQANSPLVGLLYAQDLDSAGGFEAIAGDMHWDVAMADSLENGGHLATIISPYEQRLVVAAIPENRGTFNYWIGGTDAFEEGVWQWVTGEPFTFTNWLKNDGAADEPNGGTLENYIELKGIQEDGDRPWNDEKPNVNKGYILELNPDFELVDGDGDTNNDLFSISGNELKANQAFDFETTTAPLSIRVKVTDRHDLTYEQILKIDVADVNEPSTGVNLSTTTTPEDRPAGSLVAIILTSDPDKNDQFTYELVEGSGSNDNASFTIEDNKLLSAIILDRETQVNYQVRIRSTDAEGHQAEANFTIEALDMPENTAPTEITISSTLVKENEATGTTVATLTAVDPDADLFRGGIGTYSLVFQKFATFSKAQILAERKSGHLAAITSQAEWDIMINQIGLDNLVGKISLLGASDTETEGEWQWITGETFSFENWGQGQPSNASGGEHHLEILGHNDAGEPNTNLPWNDVNSDENPRSYYILEQPMTFELAAGRGDTDNHRYQIIGNRLVTTEPSDFESLSLHRILIRVTDVGGLSYEKNLVLTVQDAPDAPVGITLDKTQVAENLPIRSVVANLSAIDQDADERHFFTLVSPSEEFYVSGTQLLTLKPLNFEQQSQYPLTLQVSDKNKLTYQQDVLIEVTDANDPPTDIQLSNLTVEENAPGGTEIATLTASDPDQGDTHIFQVVGGTDKAMFRTLGDKLTTSVPIDFEAKSSLEVIIRAIDSKKGTLDLPFTIDVIDMNDGPTDLHISQTAFAENLAPGSVVLDLSTTDQDPAFQLITESLTWESAFNDAESRGGHLATFASQAEWDRMVQSITLRNLIGLDIWLGATDEEDEGTWKWVDDTLLSYTRWANPIYVEGLEDFPPDNLGEGEHHLAIAGVTSKRLEWEDFSGENSLDAYLLEKSTTYQFVEGKGSTHNDQFKIIGSQLLTVVPADFETSSRYFILVEATDPGGLTYQKTFQLTVTDAPDAPTGISLSTNEIPENQPRGYQIATLSAKDQDINEFFSYTLIDPLTTTTGGTGNEIPVPSDNALFYIKGNILYANQPFDYEDRAEFTIHVQVKDKTQLTYGQSLDLVVTNGNDTPTAISIDSPTLPENQPRGTVIGTLTAEDPDPNERHTFTVVGGRDQALAYAKGTTLFANAPVDYETKQSLDLIVQVSDLGRATAQFPLTIEILDQNDVPTDILIDIDTISENLPSKLVAHWTMDGHGLDDGPGENHGDLTGDAHFVEEGKIGGALRLDGEGDTLTVAEFFGPHESSELTVSAWVKMEELPSSDNGDGGILVSSIVQQQSMVYEVFLWNNFGPSIQEQGQTFRNVLTFSGGDSVHIPNRINSQDNVIKAMEWQHMVGVMNEDTRSVYVDGQLVGTVSGQTETKLISLDGRKVEIGAGVAPTHSLKGWIDDVRIYVTELTPEQINTLYGNGIGGEIALDTTPTYLFLDEGIIEEDIIDEEPWAFGPLYLEDPDDIEIVPVSTTLNIDPATAGTKLWEFDTGELVRSSPAIGIDGNIYFGANDNKFYCLDSKTGQLIWDFNTTHVINSTPAITSNGTIVFGSSDKKVYALNYQSGEKIWEFETNGPVNSSPAIGKDGTIFIGSDDMLVYAINGETGDEIWTFETEGFVRSEITIGFDETVFVKSIDGKLYALDGKNGNKLWEVLLNQSSHSLSLDSDGILYIGVDKKLWAIDGTTGSKQWEFDAGNAVLSSVAISNQGILYFGADNRNVYALDKISGERIWEFPTGSRILSTPALADDNTVYIGSWDKKLYALNGLTGEKIWEFATGHSITTSANISEEGVVFFGSDDGKLYAIQGSSGPADSPWPMFGQNAQRTSRQSGVLTGPAHFELVAGIGDTDNHLFRIDWDMICPVHPLNFEVKPEYSVRVRGTDAGGLSTEKVFILKVWDEPDAPDGIALDNNSIPEDIAPNSTVGILSTFDEDDREKHTYTLISEEFEGPDEEPLFDNDYFQIKATKAGVTLMTAPEAWFDFETRNEYHLLVEVIDKDGLSDIEVVTVMITDANDLPHSISIDNAILSENMPRGTIVGTLSAEDQDPEERHTFQVVGGPDQNLLIAKGNVLSTNGPADFETMPYLEVIIAATDSKRGTAEFPLTIYVKNENDAPTDIYLDNTIVEENQPSGTPVGLLQIIDEEVADIVKATAGTHSLFLLSDGSMWAMGTNDFGQLGDGTNENRSEPVQVFDTGVIDIAAGIAHSLCVKVDGSVWSFGSNTEGELGDGTNNNSNVPTKVIEEGAYGVWAGGRHSLVLMEDGALLTFGSNIAGELGDGTKQNRNSPVLAAESGVVDVAAKGNHSLFIKEDGSLWTFGSNRNGANGDGTTRDSLTPKKVIDSGVMLIAAGGSHSLFVKEDGSLWAMGNNSAGQLGDGTGQHQSTPVRIVDSGVVFVEARANHSLFIKEDGSLWGMGSNNNGQLGVGDNVNRNVPAKSVDSGVIYATAGVNHSLFIKEDFSLWGMGKNSAGELGDGTTQNRSTPVSLKIVQPTYELVDGPGSIDNAKFSIQGKQLLLEEPLDFEAQLFYEIRVKATDIGGLSVEQTFLIEPTDAPDAPTAILLSENEIPENALPRTTIGIMEVSDADDRESHTITFIDPDATEDVPNDNDLFLIVNGRNGATLTTGLESEFDFETQKDYTVHVQVTDKDGLTYTTSLDLIVTDENDEPTSIFLTDHYIQENMRAKTTVGKLFADDVDANHFTSILSDNIEEDWVPTTEVNWKLATVDINPNQPTELLSSLEGTDIVNVAEGENLQSVQHFGDSIIQLEFLVAEGANSGVYVQGSYEIQLFDSFGEASATNQSNGAIFGVNPPLVNASKPYGEWQQLEIHFTAPKFEQGEKISNARFDKVLLNGQLIHELVEVLEPTQQGDAETPMGPLVLQGTFGNVAFRNVLVRSPKASPHTFAIIGGRHASLFLVKRDLLLTAAAFDFEGDKELEIIVEATDSAGESVQETLNIHVTNANEVPTDIVLDSYTFEENQEIGTLLANISTVDPDPIHGIGVYELIKGQYTWTQAKADAEARGGHLATVTSSAEWAKVLALPDVTLAKYWLGGTDQEEEGNWQWITGEPWLYEPWADGEPNNHGPGEHYLTTWADNSGDTGGVFGFWNDLPDEATLGYIVEYKHSFKLVDGRGGEDNSKFTLIGNQLISNAKLNFEVQPTLNILLEVTDPEGLTYQKAIVLQLTDTPDAPTGVTPAEVFVKENTPANTYITDLKMIDEDDREKHLIEFAEAPEGETSDNEHFTLSKGRLMTLSPLDYETQSTYELYVQGTDKDGLTFATWVPVMLEDVNDAPTAITLVDPVLEENTTLKVEVGTLVTTDPDDDRLSDDVVAYFGFNEGTGVLIKDSAPAGNHGTLHNPDQDDAHWVDGKFGKGLQFSANGRKVVEIPHIDAYMLDEGTFTLWCNPKVINSAQTLFSKDSTGTNTGGHIYLSLTDQFYPKVRHQPINAEATVQAANTNTAIADQWNHLAVSFGQQGLTIHLNGEVVAANVNSKAGIGQSAGGGGNPEPIAIGANTASSDANSIFPANGHFEGIIDEFFIYNRQLSQEEVAEIAQAEGPPIDTTARPPFYAFLLVPGEGDDQNDHFYIKGDKLFSKLPLDYESTPEVSIRVQSTDSGKLSYQQALTFDLTDVNDAPTDVLLDNAVVAENEPAGTLIGSLSSVDEDINDGFPEDFSRFEIIEGDFTWEEAKADAEAKGGHLTTITSSIENEAFTSFLEESNVSFNRLWIGAANSDVLDEFKWVTNEPWNFENWDESSSQPDADTANAGIVIIGDQITNYTLFSWHDVSDTSGKSSYLMEKITVPYQLVSGTGDTDNALFAIEGDQLWTRAPLNYEAQQTYSIRIKGTDIGGLSVEKVLTIMATDQPDDPVGITLSNDTLSEDAKPRTVIGTFEIMDEDERETHTVEFVEPAGAEATEYDNDLFTITAGRSGSTLDTTLEATFDYEEQAEHLILVKVTDKDGLSFTQELVVKIADANDKPSGLTIDNDELEENLRQGTQIGRLLVEDQDPLDRHTFLVSGGRDRNKVYLKRDLVYANEPIDFETQQSLDLLIRVTDLAGTLGDFPIEIHILNANDTPTDIVLGNNILAENEPSGTTVGAFSLTDPDGDLFTVRKDVISVATRGNHSLFLKEDGSVWATGQNHLGQLGDGTTKDKSIPVQIIESGVTAIAAGRDHSLFVMEDGSLWGSGNNFHGQLGTGVMEGGEFTFDARIDTSRLVMILDSGVAAVAAGEYHTLILKEDGSLWATGDNFLHQLGDGSRNDKASPVEIMESGVTAISAGAWHSLILMEDGSVWANGFNQNGQIGNGTKNNQTRPVKVINSGVVAISAGASHNLVVNSDGSVWAWGSNADGQFGNGTTTDSSSPVSVINNGVTAVSAGFEHSLILKNDGSLWAAGKNDRGQLGDGTLENQLSYMQVVASEVTAIFAGAYHSIHLMEDWSAWVSGNNLNGQLGDGSSGGGQFTFDEGIDKSTPVRIFESVVRLTDGIGDTDNHLFTVIGDELRTLQPLNFEEKEEYSIRVRGSDPGAAYVEKTFTITVTDQPDAPTDIALDNYSIHESTPGGTNVANFLVADEDARETFTIVFSQPEDGPANDNDLFALVVGRSGVTLATAQETTFNFEEKNQYSIHLHVTDKDGLTFEKTMLLNIANGEEPPTDIEFGEYSLVENKEIGTEVGTFLPVDEDLSVAGVDSHTFFLVAGEGDTNNSNFRLDRNSGILTTSKVFDFESDVTQSIRIKVTDSAGFSIEKTFTLGITNANDAPTALSLTPDDIIMVEQLPAGTLVGTLSATDIDTDDPAFEESFLYTLSFGEGNTHNDYFEIVEDQVLIKTPIVHADIPVASFHVTVADKLGAKFSKAFTITLLDRNDAPTAIDLDNNSVRENLPFGTLVGNLTASDPDIDDTHTFKLVSGSGDTGNSLFFIENGNQIVTNSLFDFEEQNQYSVRIEASDSAEATFTTTFNISITDEANEVPRFQLIVNRIPDEGGLTTGAGLHEEGTTAELSATAGPGYTFAGWTGDLPDGADSGDALLSVTMDSDKTINAYFARSFHTVDVAVYPDRHGYANGGGSILSGSEITVTAEELSGEDNVPFSHWRVNGEDLEEETEKSLTLMVEDDMEVEAVFDIGLPENFVLIPAGTYVRDYKGKYEHTASVSAFYTTTHETTKGEWYKVYKWALQNGYKFEFDPYTRNGRNMPHNDPAYEDDFPISGVSWDDMLKWCNARAEMEGWMPLYYNDEEHTIIYRDLRVVGQENSLTETHVKWRERGFRLPTELEWERAARGGIDFLEYPNGNTIDETQAFLNQGTQILSLDYTTQSDRVPNGFGLYDMAGNAWEACWDWYSKYWYENPLSQAMDTKGPNLDQTGIDRNYRTARGGSSFDSAKLLKIGIRPVFRTWYNYAITLRPVFPAPTEPDATITLASSQAHLGNVSGGGVYKIGSTATLKATPDTGAQFKEWQDADGNVLGTSSTLSITAEENTTIFAVFEDTSGNPPLYTLLTFAEPRDNGSVTGTGAYLADSTIEITATPIEGLDFAGWSGDAFGTDTTLSVTISKNMQITGAFGDTSIDTDRDGLSDLYEEVLGSSPYESDSDGDKLLDGDEVNLYASNPTSTDTDGDGHDDRTESLHRTSLIDPNNFPFIATNDLARYFTFRGQPYDYSGNKGHGTFTDVELIADRWFLGKNAYSFNGTSAFVEATGYSGVAGSTARAIAAWVRTASGNSGPVITYGSSPNAFNVQVNDSGVLEVVVGSVTLTGSTTLTDEAWHQFLVSVPEGGTIGDVAVYIDGQPETLTANGDTGTEIATSTRSSLLIGKDSSNQFFTGDIDDVRLWERVLAASEAEKLYDQEVYKEPDIIKPNILESPAGLTVAVGDTATFTVSAKAKPEPTYTWQKLVGRSWQTLNGADTETLTITNAQEADAMNYRVIVENSEGIAYSRNARLIVLHKPSIREAPPAELAFLVNRGGRIYAYVDGSGPLTYEWFKDGESLGNSRGNFWYIPSTANEAEHGGVYSFKVTNAVGEISSENITVSIIEAVVITEHPASKGIISGQSGDLSVAATGGGTLSYQWQKYDSSSRTYVNVDGATEATYTIDSMTASHEGIYQCEVTNGASTVYSGRATLSMFIPPAFTTQPRTTTIQEYDPVTLSSLASGDPAPAYMWQKLNTDTQEWEDQIKYQRADFIVGKTPISFAGKYRVKATNDGGVAISDEVDLIIHYKPLVTQDLVSITANEDTDVTLTLEADALDRSGTNITYKWFHNNVQVFDGDGISGTSTNTVQLTAVDRNDGGTWYCKLSNSIGETQARAMKLLVIEKPYATTTLSDLTVIEGNSFSLSVGIRGSKPFTFQWYKDGQAINGATLNKLYISPSTTGDSGEYTFEATNPAGSLNQSANVTVTAPATGATAPRILAGVDTETPEHDADGDGLNNLLEQALGSDPANPDSTYSPTLDLVEDGTGQQYLSYHFTLSNAATDLTTIIEVSTDLITWEPLDLNEVTLTTLDRGDLTETTVYLPTSQGQRFLRLRVEK